MVDPYSFSSSNNLPITSWGREVTGEKSVAIALILGFFFPGLGIAYAGKIGLGVTIFILDIVCYILFLATVWLVIGVIFSIPLLIFLIYGMIKAYSMCDENNRLWREYLASR